MVDDVAVPVETVEILAYTVPTDGPEGYVTPLTLFTVAAAEPGPVAETSPVNAVMPPAVPTQSSPRFDSYR